MVNIEKIRKYRGQLRQNLEFHLNEVKILKARIKGLDRSIKKCGQK